MIYVIRVQRYLKIGVAVDVTARLLNIQAACPFPVHVLYCSPGGQKEELALHRRFGSDHHFAEWFHAVPPLVYYFKTESDNDHNQVRLTQARLDRFRKQALAHLRELEDDEVDDEVASF
jgi:hypothetical protein